MQEQQSMLVKTTHETVSECDGRLTPFRFQLARSCKTYGRTALILLTSVFLYSQQVSASSPSITGEDLRADISQAHELLRKYHPNLTAHTSRRELDALHQRLLETTNDQNTKAEAFLAIAELVGAACDEHTWVQPGYEIEDAWPEGWPWYDYPLIVDSGRLYVEDPDTGFKDEVLFIDDVSGLDIAASLAKRSGSNGCMGDDGTLLVNETLTVYGNIVAALIGVSESYVLKTRPAGTQGVWTKTVQGTDLYATAIDSIEVMGEGARRHETVLAEAGFKPRPLDPAVKRAGLDYRYATDRNLAYLGIETFKVGALADKGVDLAMRDIIRKKPDALIIDLVDNPGGTINTVQTVLAFLLPRSHRLFSRVYTRNVSKTRPDNFEYYDAEAEKGHKEEVKFFRSIRSKGGKRSVSIARRSFGKPDYKGRIYVLVNPASRSGSTALAANLKRLRDVTIVGSLSATDTVTYCSTASGSFELPHTGFHMHIPDLCYHGAQNRLNDDATLVPDIEVSALESRLVDLRSNILKAALDDFDRVVTN